MQHPELPICAFLVAALVLIPLPSHWRAKNVSTLALMLWLCTANVIYGVNAIVWAGNINNPIPVWCDITSKIIVGASYALPLCTICICKHLELVSSSRKASYDIRDRHRRMIFEGVMCFLIPVIFMALHYIVQGHRYDIIESAGCQAAVYVSIPALLIIWLPQLLFSVITLIYASLALRNFIHRRLIFAAHLQNSNSALTTNRYLRLIAMSIAEMIWGTSLSALNLRNNVTLGLRPWTNWADVHSNFSRVDRYPILALPQWLRTNFFLVWWMIPASGVIFFIFFGFSEEVVKEYRQAGAWIKKRFFKTSGTAKDQKLHKSLPFFRAPRPLKLAELKSSFSFSQTPSAFKPLSSAASQVSQSTATLAMSPRLHKTSLSTDSTHPPPVPEKDLGYYKYSEPITRRLSNATTAYPEDNTDTFTISTISYYAGPSSPVIDLERMPPCPSIPYGSSPLMAKEQMSFHDIEYGRSAYEWSPATSPTLSCPASSPRFPKEFDTAFFPLTPPPYHKPVQPMHVPVDAVEGLDAETPPNTNIIHESITTQPTFSPTRAPHNGHSYLHTSLSMPVFASDDRRRPPSPPSPPAFTRTTITTLNQQERQSPRSIEVMVHETKTMSTE